MEDKAKLLDQQVKLLIRDISNYDIRDNVE